MIFWSFVLLAAYLVYIYPLHRLTTWLGYPTVLNVPAIVGLWFAVVAILWLSFRSSSRALEVTLYNWMGIGFVFFTPCVGHYNRYFFSSVVITCHWAKQILCDCQCIDSMIQ